ncbi:MAG: peptidylprolyl isomerase, partial [Ignavibacteriales bacterium]|nr:peptidylprolyl isomerase [Ignavibacteriales bacterium]
MGVTFTLSLLLFYHGTGHNDTTTIASVGGLPITAEELLQSYEVGPAFVKRSQHPLRRHLDFMIYERLLALQARRYQYDTTYFVRERAKALEEDLTVDELYKDEILSKIKLTNREIEEGIRKEKINLRLRWIYASTKLEADRIARSLRTGVSFDSLFATQLDSAVSAQSRSLETTLFKLERDNLEFAKAIALMKNQEVSSPVAGPDGFYIVRVDEVWQNPLSTQSDYVTLKDQVMKVLQTAKADGLAREFARERMKAANPVIKAGGFNIVLAYMADKGLSRDARVRWAIPATFMTEAGPQPITASGKFLNLPLVVFGNHILTVRDYVTWYDIRQFQLRVSSLKAFNSSVKRTIWRMVQDKLLSEEAYRRGFQHRVGVKREAALWETKLLYLAGRSHVVRSISLPDAVLEEQYQRHRASYRDAAGKQLSFADAHDKIWMDVYYSEEAKVLFRTIQELKKEFPVMINKDALKRLEANVT